MKKLSKVAIHSVPRSGSTWLGSIFDSHPQVNYKLQPLFSYAFKDALNSESTIEQINSFFQLISESNDDFLMQNEGKAKGIIPEFSKTLPMTHICYKEVRYHHILRNLLLKDNEIKVIGIIRNPMAVIWSWLNAPKEFKKELGWKMEEEWRYAPSKNLNKPEEFNGFEKWKEVSLLFEQLRKEFPNQFYLVNYKNLLINTLDTVTELFNFVGLTVKDQTFQFLNKSRKANVLDAYGVYKNKENDREWVDNLPDFIVKEIIEDLNGTSLEKYLY